MSGSSGSARNQLSSSGNRRASIQLHRIDPTGKESLENETSPLFHKPLANTPVLVGLGFFFQIKFIIRKILFRSVQLHGRN